MRYFKQHGDLPTKTNSTIKRVNSFIEHLYFQKGYIALTFESLLDDLRNNFPELRKISPARLRSTLKALLCLKPVYFGTKPAKVSTIDYKRLQAIMMAVVLEMVREGICIVCGDESAFLTEGFRSKAIGNMQMVPKIQKRSCVIGLHLAMAVSQMGIEGLQILKTAFRAPNFEAFIFQLVEHLKDRKCIDLDRKSVV